MPGVLLFGPLLFGPLLLGPLSLVSLSLGPLTRLLLSLLPFARPLRSAPSLGPPPLGVAVVAEGVLYHARMLEEVTLGLEQVARLQDHGLGLAQDGEV